MDNHLWNLSLYTGRKTDYTFAILAKNLLINAWLTVKTINKPQGNQLYQIVIAFLIFRQQNQMIAGLFVYPFKTAPGRKITFAAEDDLDARFSLFLSFFIQFLRCLIKVYCAVHIAVVSDGDAIHPHLHGTLQQFFRF